MGLHDDKKWGVEVMSLDALPTDQSVGAERSGTHWATP
jgi:hypothetical protein